MVTQSHRLQVAVLGVDYQEPLAAEEPWAPVGLEICSLIFRHLEEEDLPEAFVSFVLMASPHQAVACPRLVVPGLAVAVLANLDHRMPGSYHCCPLALWILVTARQVGVPLKVPRRDILSIESDQNHLAKRQLTARKRCGDEDTARHAST